MAEAQAPGRVRTALALLLAAAVMAGGAVLVERSRTTAEPVVGLFTSLPILWRETHELSDLLKSDAPPHWAPAVLAAHGSLRSLDTLAAADGKLPLEPGALLVLAQPRPLSPAENVALDDWVRGGGRVLLFADPMLTAQSAFPLGDKRRPQDIALLSPILSRWGLELQFDEDQPPGAREVALLGGAIPVDLPGRFAARPAAGCTLYADALVARCPVGKGEAIAVADAALLENGTTGDEASRAAMLDRLLRAFRASRDSFPRSDWGNGGTILRNLSRSASLGSLRLRTNDEFLVTSKLESTESHLFS